MKKRFNKNEINKKDDKRRNREFDTDKVRKNN